MAWAAFSVASAQAWQVAVVGAADLAALEDVRDRVMCADRGLGYNDFIGQSVRVAHSIERIDLFEAAVTTPTVDDLQDYDAIIVFSEMPFANPVLMGDVVSVLVESGRGVVVGGRAFADGFDLRGRFVTQGMSPFQQTGPLAQPGGDLCIEAVAPSWSQGPERGHPILFDFFGFRGGSASTQAQGLEPRGQATEIARWCNGEPALATLVSPIPRSRPGRRHQLRVAFRPGRFEFVEQRNEWGGAHRPLGLVAARCAAYRGVRERVDFPGFELQRCRSRRRTHDRQLECAVSVRDRPRLG